MARADSTIRVNIIGDAKGLSKELGKAEKSLGGIGKIAAGIGIGIVTNELLDFGATAINEADRAADALTKLGLKLGPLADDLDKSADSFASLGQSRQDILELESAFADAATAAQLGAPDIAQFADDAAATAAALALLGEADAATNMDLIGKAAAGGDKALRALGISLTDAEVAARAMRDTGKATADQLTASELAAAAYSLVLEKLKPKLDAVAEGSGDVEQKQAELQARFETLTGRIGEHLEGPLNDLLAWMLAGIDGLEQMGDFLAIVEQGWRNDLAPLAAFTKGLNEAAAALQGLLGFGPVKAGNTGMPGSSKNSKNSGTSADRNVINAINDSQSANGRPIL